MEKRNIIVIGASAGGFEALKKLVADLPVKMDASVFIVWHMSPDLKGILPQVLNRSQTMFAAHALDQEKVNVSRIYIAPPDHHLILEKGSMRITRGPKENRFRPAVDPLFRSAAYAYGNRVIGIVLSGALDDGSAGLWTIKQFGGTTIVQDPNDAEVCSMPANAMKAVNVDHIVPIEEMGSLLARLVEEPVLESTETNLNEKEKTQLEINIAMEENGLKNSLNEFGKPTHYTCPDCHGVLSSIKEGNRLRFRCHTGHAFSPDSLLATISTSIEDGLWSAIRNMQESVFLLNHMGDHFAEVNQPKVAATFFKKAKDAEGRAKLVRRAVFSHEQLTIETVRQQTGETHQS